jgi:hypothetical protein
MRPTGMRASAALRPMTDGGNARNLSPARKPLSQITFIGVFCGGEGISDAFYCFECTRLEKDRDGCPKIINLESSRTDSSGFTRM